MGNSCEVCKNVENDNKPRNEILIFESKNIQKEKHSHHATSILGQEDYHKFNHKNNFDELLLIDGQLPSALSAESRREMVKFRNGAIYDGDIVNNQREGRGTQVWPDQSKYEGDWKGNAAWGYGKFSNVNGDTYEGEWVENHANGYGVFENRYNEKYEGDWKMDQPHGKGK